MTSPIIPEIIGVFIGLTMIVIAFVATDVRGALSRGNGRPPTIVERALLFLVGFIFCASALYRLLK